MFFASWRPPHARGGEKHCLSAVISFLYGRHFIFGTPMLYSLLPQRALISLSGADAEIFLQGLVSNDVHKLKPGMAMYAALLSPQGKFLHDFFLYRRGDAILLDADKARLPDLLARLSLYKLRAKVAIETLPESEGIIAMWEEKNSPPYVLPAGGGNILVSDPRLPPLGYRLIGDAEKIKTFAAAQGWKEETPAAYDAMRIGLGVPDGAYDMIIDRSFLLEFGFEYLHGVDFSKGCYVGQEVTARSKHRAQLRKSLYQVKSAGAELPPPETKIMAGETEIGQLRSHAGSIGLAVLKVEEAAKGNLRAGEMEITASRPLWMSPIS